MAYLSRLNHECAEEGCKARTQYAVFNNHNAHMGEFCTRHANLKLKILQDLEKLSARTQVLTLQEIWNRAKS